MEDPNQNGISRRAALGLAAGASTGILSAAVPKQGVTAHLDDVVAMDASSLANAIHTRRISCVEVMSAYLSHIEKVNPRVNAIVALQDRADLLHQARERDAQLTRGASLGPMHGFPHAVKDLRAVRGMLTTMGSPILKNNVPAADALLVERMRKSGAIFIGKTNTPEFGLGSHTYNPVYGITRNAYDPSRSAGGSSGGAAVALALRMVPLADGSDYGGSLRNPAGWNGVFGLRPSIGRVPSESADAWLPTMSTLGPMARNVSDLALLLSVQAGFDARAPLSLDGEGSAFHRRLESDPRGKRVAWVRDFNGHAPCDPEVLSVCARALRVFESLGCQVEEAAPEFDLESVWQALIRLRGWQEGGGILKYYNDAAHRQLLKPEAIYEVEMGLKQSAFDISAASAVRTAWSNAVHRFLERYDYFIVPTAQLFPFDAELHWPHEVGGVTMQTYHEWMKVAFFVTMSGCPALAAPAGFSARGLPIGIQIVAPNRRELDCLQLAYAYEAAMDPAWKRLAELART